jgi:hypothetical protein
MKRVEIEADQMPGQDSFLDVITNIVGILILLVLVVGLRASHAVHDVASSHSASESSDEGLRQAFISALNKEKGVRDLAYRVTNARHETAFREEERLWLNTTVAAAEDEIAARRARLSNGDQQDFDVRRKLADSQATLDELTRQQIALMSQEPATEQIECEPTPLAKAVTGKEIHLWLADDHVAIVPFDDLLEELKQDVSANIWRLRDQDEMDRTIGPFHGFRIRYWFEKADVMARNEAGEVRAGSVSRFSHCYFLPVTTPAGEPAADALQANSEMFQYLQRFKPDATTVTIWTYTGNYERLRVLKKAIRERGFQIALRPLPKGMPIGASSHGSESLAQ